MKKSLKFIEQCISKIPFGLVKCSDNKIIPPLLNKMKQSMEFLIHHFKMYTQGVVIPANETYVGTETPKGKFGVYLISNNINRPYRCKIKAPGFTHLTGINS